MFLGVKKLFVVEEGIPGAYQTAMTLCF